ncbi:MAG TPA: alpha/beta fold hydrolase [Polyangia bacterium]
MRGLQRVEVTPFGLGPTDARAGVVLVHGFTGTPFEMRLLGEHLASSGFQVVGPQLAGHVGTTGDLARTRWPDWLDSVERAFDALSARCDEVAVCGLSLGGILTLELARLRPEVKAIAALAPALWLYPAAMRFDRMMQRLPRSSRWAMPKLAGSDIFDPEMRRLNKVAQGRAGMPLAALHSLIELGRELTPRLSEITQPALLIHSRRDHTVPPACSERIAVSLGSKVVKRLELERSFHVITLDVEREQVFRAVAAHLHEHLQTEGG